MRRRTRRIVAAIGIAAGVLSALTFVVHLRFVQVAMGWTNADGTGACPFGHDRPRSAAARGVVASAPVFGVMLGRSSRADVERWARAEGVVCIARRSMLECRDVPDPQLAPGTVWFELDESDTVVTVKAARRSSTLAPIASAFAAAEAALGGVPLASTGSTAELSTGLFYQATRELRADGYSALIRATNMGDGYLLTERYTL